MPPLIKKALGSQSLTLEQTVNVSFQYLGMPSMRVTSCSKQRVTVSVLHQEFNALLVVLNTDKYEWPQMVLATDVLAVVSINWHVP